MVIRKQWHIEDESIDEFIFEEINEIPLGIPKTGSNNGILLAISMILSAMMLAGAAVVIRRQAK